ncbi:putative 5-methyltetrahydrofolate--homocysteine methyltransferase [[Clostridium] methylpentosum DSM 5476]|uniref:Methionine synthase n=1 Tax=[Clostridium] methylpentosum DSM 5476 TaxID=537013 RepID=C0ECI7_9FIRM|nr:putative 5-methyltetrahydrofolate--homocysteine methyltransferase [[Clostridium] methylpentosum DSM 5476]MDY3989407.1 homocysteine S-methyltransferase family protein [Massilioclostridium sp.]MEE1492557.1 homocysteine S-methyltransferase family protein [Massilioclostridium sp.]
MDVREYLKDHILVFDGAMGTMLQNKGMQVGDLPETLNFTHPELVTEIHREYVEAGSDVVSANTFQANEFKLHGCGYTVEQVITQAVKLGKQSGAKFVALDVGPLGQLVEPMGTVKFETAYELFRQQVVTGERAGADLIIIETMSDLYETKAALLAAKENTSLPVIVSLTYQGDGRTFTGTDPITGTITLQSLGADAVGVNCSIGPDDLIPIVEQILTYAQVPVIMQANAGLPKIEDGKTVYDVHAEEFAEAVSRMMDRGVRIVGGCCGTDPDYIRLLRKKADGMKPVATNPKRVTAVTSGTRTVVLDRCVTVIGERINPTGKKRLKEALRENRMDYIVGEAINQANAGADVLDVNVGLPEIDEPAMIARAVKEVQGVTNLPVQVDSSDPAAIESGVRACNGRPIINSVNGKAENLAAVLPIVKKYGAVVVGLTLDEDGIPATAEGRFAVAKRIVETAAEYGIPKEDILIDCLTLTASAQQEQVLATLDAIKLVKERLGVKTVLGVSNVSFGLPSRPLLNSVFLAAAFGAGLDAPILNPLSKEMMDAVNTFRVINYQDRDAVRYIDRYANAQPAQQAAVGEISLKEMIVQGRKEEAPAKVRELLQTTPALEVIDSHFVPALDIVGQRYEKGEIFLPQLMQSAETVKASFEVIKASMDAGEKTQSKGRVIVATVLGDIHDIGKNIAKMLLENYGYDVIDLGKDVPIETVVQTAKEQDIQLIGLSALMTTTVKNMKDTISAIRGAGLNCKIMVGGAVLNEEYAEFVGADFYVKDGRESVELAQSIFR